MTETTTGPATSSRKRSLVRPALWGAGVLLTLAAIGYLALPPIARHYAIRILGDTLGREVTIERVALNPFTLTATIDGLKVMGADGGSEALGFDRLRANLEAESVVRGGLVLHELALAGPRLELVLGADGRHNWADVAERIAALAEAGAADEAASSRGALFSIGNIRVSGGRVRIDDQPRGLKHELADVDIGVPFVSNLPVKVDVFVEPSLSASLNGDPLLLSARTKPFAETQETVLDVVLKEFDLAPWLAYLPFEPRFRLPSARLTTNLELSFRQQPDAAPMLALRGPLQVDKLVLQDGTGAPLAQVAELELEFADVQPLIGRWHFTRLRLVQPEVDLVRLKDGGLNLAALLPPAPAKAAAGAKDAAAQPARKGTKADAARSKESKGTEGKAGTAKGAEAAAGEAGRDVAAAAAPASRPLEPDFLLAHARIRDGVLRFEDRSLAEPFRARIEAINLDLRDLATDADMPAEIRLDYVTDAGEKLVHEDRLRLKPFEFEGLLSFEALRAARYAPYLAAALPGGEVRDGSLTGSLRYRVVSGEDGAPDIDLSAETLALRDFALALKGSKEPAIKVPALELRGAVVDLGGRSVRVAELDVQGASVAAVRQKNGEIDLLRLLGPQPARAKAAGPEWLLAVDRLALQAAALRIEDRSVRRPVTTAIDGIGLELHGFSTARGNATRLKLESRINKRGKLGVSGEVALEPLKAALKLDLRSIDLLPLQPYVLAQTNIAISRGSLSTQGTLNLQRGRGDTLLASFRGDLGVADFASVDKLNSADFLRWRSLRVGGINARLEPLSLAIRRVAVDDFYSRLILDEEGRLNLREIQGGGGGDRRSASAPAAEAVQALEPAGEAAFGGTAGTPERPAQGRRSVELVPPSAPPPPLRIEHIEFKRGNIAFSDRFIQPNYDVNLTDMAGELVGLSTDQDTIARLDLSGRVDKAAPVEVRGELNPFRQDAHLDIVATVKDFELPGLSSYSGKYVGYGIARGKLSAELNYKIVERKLTATNQIFLDQLAFGDKVDSPDAVNLPVQLAVSLLKNSRGEIDLHLPVSGTLDDPEFSVFGLVVKMLFNLIGKAITSPFALLGAVVSGGEELSQLAFEPGVAAPGEAQRDKLATLAKALRERPALRLDITGRADPAVDTEGLRQAALQRLLRAQKLKAMVGSGKEAPSVDAIEVDAAEYPELLKKAYRAAEFEKPKNFFGLVKDLPPAEMEALLLANLKVGDEELRGLARRRAQAVREWLTSAGEVAGERVFVLEPKVEPAADGGQVQFALR